MAKLRPIVVITSNNEKELPDAFLRRCAFHCVSQAGGSAQAAVDVGVDRVSALQKTGVAIERRASEIPFIGLLLKKETDVQQLLTMKDTTRGLKM